MGTKPLDEETSTVTPIPNRRREERHFITFGRPIHLSWQQELSLLGNLLEVSRSGFRIAHQYRNFAIGQEVRVVLPWGTVRAHVQWNRISRKHVETGFSILPDE